MGVSPWLAMDGKLGKCLESFPEKLRVKRLPNSALLEALQSGELDAALWNEGNVPANRGFVCTPLAKEDLCLFVPEDERPCPLLVCPGWPRSFI